MYHQHFHLINADLRKDSLMNSTKLKQQAKRVTTMVGTQMMVAAATMQSFAYSTEGSAGLGGHAWPWTQFLRSLMQELTGPLPMILGIMGIVGAAIALFSGNGGDGTRKFILLIFVISIALAAPSLMDMLSLGATGSGFVIP